MRTYGRFTNPRTGVKKWVKVEADAQGFEDNVWLTALIQHLKGHVGESPFFAQSGIPQQPCAVQMIYPDFYINSIQNKFADKFRYLAITAVLGASVPTYNVQVVTHSGVTLNASTAV